MREISLVPLLGSVIRNRLQEQREMSTSCFCHEFLPHGTAALWLHRVWMALLLRFQSWHIQH